MRPISKPARLLFAALAAMMMSGCASPQASPDFFGDLASHPEFGTVISGVPDPLLRSSMAGHDALAAVLTFWKHPADPGVLAAALATDYRGREREEALMNLAGHKGMWTYATYGNMAALQTRVTHGVPVIVELVDDAQYAGRRRFALVVGYDEKEKRVLCHEGRGRPRVYDYVDFMVRWVPVRSWMLLVMPPSQPSWTMTPAELATRARFYESRDQLDLALNDLTAAMAADPVNSRICVNAANLHRKRGEPDKAEGLYRRAIDLNPHEGQAFNNLAYLIAEQGGNLLEAENLAKQALLLEPTNPVMLDTLGFILHKQGRFDEAVAHLEQASARARFMPAPKQREIALHLVRGYLDAGRRDDAERVLRELQATDPSLALPDDLQAILLQP
ncbi:MAG: tetratricopeptide repeat protein [bacterium]